MKTGELFILGRERTPRLEYVAGFLSDVTGLRFSVITRPIGSPFLINYSQSPADGAFNIPDSGFLTEKTIMPFEPEIVTDKGYYLFPFTGFDAPFDLFSAIFYLVTRYEEYLPYVPDRFGRFEARQSYSWRHNFLQEPVIDQWLQWFKTALTFKFPALDFPQTKFRFISTVDIDNPWAFLNRKPGVNITGILKNILNRDFSVLRRRLKVIAGKESDPFDVYSFIRETEESNGLNFVFFFLLSDNGGVDLNRSLKSSNFTRLVRELALNRQTGIHPSFASNFKSSLLIDELERFKSLTGESPVRSRQHFLMLKFPETYRKLISIGITDDYTMGYASLPSFRAGTTYPFRFYDLEKEQETALMIHPFTIMDVTLQQYMSLTPDSAVSCISAFINKIRKVNGVFTSLWHNESLSEYGIWKGWRKVFTEMIRIGIDQPSVPN